MKISIFPENDSYYLVACVGLNAFVFEDNGWTSHKVGYNFVEGRARERESIPVTLDFIQDIHNITDSERNLTEMLHPGQYLPLILDSLANYIEEQEIL